MNFLNLNILNDVFSTSMSAKPVTVAAHKSVNVDEVKVSLGSVNL